MMERQDQLDLKALLDQLELTGQPEKMVLLANLDTMANLDSLELPVHAARTAILEQPVQSDLKAKLGNPVKKEKMANPDTPDPPDQSDQLDPTEKPELMAPMANLELRVFQVHLAKPPSTKTPLSVIM